MVNQNQGLKEKRSRSLTWPNAKQIVSSAKYRNKLELLVQADYLFELMLPQGSERSPQVQKSLFNFDVIGVTKRRSQITRKHQQKLVAMNNAYIIQNIVSTRHLICVRKKLKSPKSGPAGTSRKLASDNWPL